MVCNMLECQIAASLHMLVLGWGRKLLGMSMALADMVELRRVAHVHYRCLTWVLAHWHVMWLTKGGRCIAVLTADSACDWLRDAVQACLCVGTAASAQEQNHDQYLPAAR